MRASDSGSVSAGTVLLTIIAAALALMAGTIGVIRQAGDLGPKVGDVIMFEPLHRLSSDMQARLPAMAADGTPGPACVLDVRTMHAHGGSLVIEARQPGAQFGYRVHWAGQRSSNDGADCGASADLLLSLHAIEVLATAAGGFGVAAHRRGASFMRSAVTVP